MDKPTSVARIDFMNSLSQLITKSGLPPYVLEPIFEDITNDMKLLVKKQYESDLRAYQKACNKEKSE